MSLPHSSWTTSSTESWTLLLDERERGKLPGVLLHFEHGEFISLEMIDSFSVGRTISLCLTVGSGLSDGAHMRIQATQSKFQCYYFVALVKRQSPHC